jgi:S-adenosylmethionine/arginine decarboxylase-like enzyme
MEVLIPPQSVYCDIPDNEGVTGFAVITTSHLAMHIWPKENVVQLDVYSCKDFDPKIVYDLLNEFMSVEKVSSALILRDDEVSAEKLDF